MTRNIAALCALALVLTACGRSGPEVAYTDPIYDKIGNATCPGGYRLASDPNGGMMCYSFR